MKRYLSSILVLLLVAGCGTTAQNSASMDTSQRTTALESAGQVSISFGEEELNEDYVDTTSTITLDGTSVTIEGEGASVSGSSLTITSGGTYVFSGTLDEGSITVDVSEEESVHLVFNDVTITSTNGPAIYVNQAKRVVLTVLSGTENTLNAAGENADGKSGGIYSRDDLVINGGGTLAVNTEDGDGIHSNDSLKTVNVILEINSASDGLDAKELIGIKDCILTVNAQSDGLKAKGDTDEETGITAAADIRISGGVVHINAEDDAFQASGDILSELVEVDAVAGGGYENAEPHTDSSGGFGNFSGMMGPGFGFGGESGQGRPEDTEGFGPQGGFGQNRPGSFEEDGDNSFDPEERPDFFGGFHDFEEGNGFDFRDEDGFPQGGFGFFGFLDPDEDEFDDEEWESYFGFFDEQEAEEFLNRFEEELDGWDERFGSQDFGEDDFFNDFLDLFTETEDTSSSSKGYSADGSIVFYSGVYAINASDDAVNAENDVTIADGTLTIYAGDDAIHSDANLTIDGGTITIVESYEGLEATNIIINDGEIDLTSSDDGINAANKQTEQSFGMDEDDGSTLTINGGTIQVTASGDGIDLNGSGVMNGGTLTVYGPESSGNGALDYAGTFVVNGGTILAGGASGMAMTPSASSSVYTIEVGITDTKGEIEVLDSDGNVILSYSSDRYYNDLVISSDLLEPGNTYVIQQNGNELGTVTISDSITYVNRTQGNNGFGGGFRPGSQSGGPGTHTENTRPGTRPDQGNAGTPEGLQLEEGQAF